MSVRGDIEFGLLSSIPPLKTFGIFLINKKHFALGNDHKPWDPGVECSLLNLKCPHRAYELKTDSADC